MLCSFLFLLNNRCDVTTFKPSKSQKKIIKKVNKFLATGIRDEVKESKDEIGDHGNEDVSLENVGDGGGHELVDLPECSKTVSQVDTKKMHSIIEKHNVETLAINNVEMKEIHSNDTTNSVSIENELGESLGSGNQLILSEVQFNIKIIYFLQKLNHDCPRKKPN